MKNESNGVLALRRAQKEALETAEQILALLREEEPANGRVVPLKRVC